MKWERCYEVVHQSVDRLLGLEELRISVVYIPVHGWPFIYRKRDTTVANSPLCDGSTVDKSLVRFAHHFEELRLQVSSIENSVEWATFSLPKARAFVPLAWRLGNWSVRERALETFERVQTEREIESNLFDPAKWRDIFLHL